MENNHDFLLQNQEKKKLPEMLNVLTILTFVGCGFTVLSTLFLPLGCKVLEMEEIVDKMKPNEIAVLESTCSNLIPIIAIIALGTILCLVGAILMRKLKQSGYLIYIVGQIIPIAAGFALGTQNFSDWKQLIGLVLPIVFIILYTTQRKHLVD